MPMPPKPVCPFAVFWFPFWDFAHWNVAARYFRMGQGWSRNLVDHARKLSKRVSSFFHLPGSWIHCFRPGGLTAHLRSHAMLSFAAILGSNHPHIRCEECGWRLCLWESSHGSDWPYFVVYAERAERDAGGQGSLIWYVEVSSNHSVVAAGVADLPVSGRKFTVCTVHNGCTRGKGGAADFIVPMQFDWGRRLFCLLCRFHSSNPNAVVFVSVCFCLGLVWLVVWLVVSWTDIGVDWINFRHPLVMQDSCVVWCVS